MEESCGFEEQLSDAGTVSAAGRGGTLIVALRHICDVVIAPDEGVLEGAEGGGGANAFKSSDDVVGTKSVLVGDVFARVGVVDELEEFVDQEVGLGAGIGSGGAGGGGVAILECCRRRRARAVHEYSVVITMCSVCLCESGRAAKRAISGKGAGPSDAQWLSQRIAHG